MRNKFGETIYEARRSARITLGEMADRVGVSPGYVSDIEQGRKAPPAPDLVARIATELKLELSLLTLFAAEVRGAFKLLADQLSPKHMEVGAALERQWASLDEQQLSDILSALNNHKD